MPTTTNYGWTYPSSSGYVKNGATDMQTIATGIDTTLGTALGGNYPGLRLIKKQTIGSAVSSVQVTSAFSADYENYKIVISGGVASVSNALLLTLGATVTGYYGSFISAAYTTATVTGSTDNNAARFTYAGFGTTSNLNMNVDLESPFLTKTTQIRTSHVGAVSTGTAGNYGGFLNNATSYTSFTIAPTSGGATLTGGTIYVYGYGAS